MAERIATAPEEGLTQRLLGWYAELRRKERHTFWACFAGWGLDGMDFKLYGWVIPTLIATWGIGKGQAGSIQTAAVLASAVGGWLGGMLADRFGRVRVLQASILWFSLFTALCALANSYGELLALRMLHGLGFGAEWGVGAALVGEIVRDRHRGTATGTVHSAWAVGGALSAGLASIIFALFPATLAWRLLFAAGVLPALLVFYIRRFVEESPIYLESRGRGEDPGALEGLVAIFSPELRRATVLGAMVSMGCLGGAYAVQTWLPSYLLTQRHLSMAGSGGFIIMFEVAHFFGYIVGAYFADLYGRRFNFIFMAVATGITVAAYMFLDIGNAMTFVLGIPLGFFSSGTYSGIGAILAEIFPTRVRGSGIGFCFNFGRGMGAVFPLLVGILSAALPLSSAIGIFAAAAYGLVVVAALLLPETRGRALAG